MSPRHLAAAVLVGELIAGCGSRRIMIPLMPPLIGPPKAPVAWTESFDGPDTQPWREVEVHGHTLYEAVVLDGRHCLRAQSYAAASILLSAVRFDPDTYEWLAWDWRVDRFVEGEALDRKAGSDASARVYVYFETKGLPWQKRNLDYVWSASLPVGTILESAFSRSSKIIVAESGADALGQWRRVRRNLEDDYERAFGGHPPQVLAIGVMADTDNTGGDALAYFDEMRVSRDELDTDDSGQSVH